MENNLDTIFALATPYGKSGVAIIRISGSRAREILKFLDIKLVLNPHEIKFTRLYNPIDKQIIDHAMIAFFQSPKSFTGEDTIELYIHGSKAIIKTILNLLSNLPGFRLAEPGEFAKRSFLNGKMDLTEAEGLADLIEAETMVQHKQAIRQLSGELEALYESWKEKILEIMALIEAYIDFPEEDIPTFILEETSMKIEQLKQELKLHLNDNRRGEKIREGINATIFGAPNVGKSSILNYLAKREVAIVSDIAGTTRDIIEINLDIGGYPLSLSDTAGLREVTQDQIEQEGIKRALIRAQNADIKIAVFDYNMLPELDESTLSNIDSNTIILFNKCDEEITTIPKLPINFPKTLFISVKYEKNITLLIDALQNKLEQIIGNIEAPVITRSRHRQNLEDCLQSLNQLSFNIDIELIAEDLRLAANSLGRITGKIEVDEILGKIFSKFCIGK